MIILKDRKRQEARIIFENKDYFIEYLKSTYNNINFTNSILIGKCEIIYNNMIVGDELIKWIRFDRWLPKQFGFKFKNILQINFWLERGWSEAQAKFKISNISKDRANKAVKTKSKIKDNIFFNGDKILIKFKSGEFYSKIHPKCNKCGLPLELKKKNIKNVVTNFYYQIIKCSNDKCVSHNLSKTDKYLAYLPNNVAVEKIEKIKEIISNSNRLCENFWLNQGFTLEETKKEISKLQSEYSKQVENRFVVSKDNLRNNNFSEEEINEICLTPVNIKFWLNKGCSDDEAKNMVSEHQKNATKYIDYKKRLLPSNIEYWVNKGLTYEESKIKVKKNQTTFSKEICIQKYGEVEGLRVFTERQKKWSKSSSSGGNLKIGYSKISQDLFYEILEKYQIKDRNKIYFATHNKEYKLNKCESEGGIWLYDFTDTKNKRIIEYNGDMFHGNPKKYKSTDYPHPFRKNITAQEMWDKDKRKLDVASKEGFEVMVIWDSEYRWGNKQEIINKCLDFLEN